MTDREIIWHGTWHHRGRPADGPDDASGPAGCFEEAGGENRGGEMTDDEKQLIRQAQVVPEAIEMAIRVPGYGGILWQDEQSGQECWNWVPMGVGYILSQDNQERLLTDPDRWIRPCYPVKVRFWRGA